MWLVLGFSLMTLMRFSCLMRCGVVTSARASKLAVVLDDCGLPNLGVTWSDFTWYRRARVAWPISRRLDWALSDCAWRNSFPKAYVENLCRLHSDLRLILLCCRGFVSARSLRPFCFQAAWLTHKEFPSVVHSAWGKGYNTAFNNLERVKRLWNLIPRFLVTFSIKISLWRTVLEAFNGGLKLLIPLVLLC